MDVNNNFGSYVERCCDKYTLMPRQAKNELLGKVFLIALAAGLLSAATVVLLPLAPLVAVGAGSAAFLHYADQYKPEDFIGYVINNPQQAIQRFFHKPHFRGAGINRVRMAFERV